MASLPSEVLAYMFSFVITNESQSDCELKTNISLVCSHFYDAMKYFKLLAYCGECETRKYVMKVHLHQCHFCDKYFCMEHAVHTCDDPECQKCVCQKCDTLIIIGRWVQDGEMHYKYRKIDMKCHDCTGRMCCTSTYDYGMASHNCDHCRHELAEHVYEKGSTHNVHHRLIKCEHQCNTILKTEDKMYSHTCDKLCCENCVSVCSVCGKPGCRDHSVFPCERCEREVCSDDRCLHYARVGKRVCKECSDICSQCGTTISESEFRYLEKFCSNGDIVVKFDSWERGYVYFTALYNLHAGWCDHNEQRYCSDCLEHHECSGVPKYSENSYLDFTDVGNYYDCDRMWDNISKCEMWVNAADQSFRIGHPCVRDAEFVDPDFLAFWSKIGENRWLNHVSLISVLKYMMV